MKALLPWPRLCATARSDEQAIDAYSLHAATRGYRSTISSPSVRYLSLMETTDTARQAHTQAGTSVDRKFRQRSLATLAD